MQWERRSMFVAAVAAFAVFSFGFPTTQARAAEDDAANLHWTHTVYFGAGMGMAFGTADFDAAGNPTLTDIPDTDEMGFAWQALVGYRPFPYLAVEAGFIDFGQVEGRCGYKEGFCEGSLSSFSSADGNIDALGGQLSVLGRYPFNEYLAPFVRVGGFVYDQETKVRATPASSEAAEVRASDNETKFDFLVGGGVDMLPPIAPGLAFRIEYGRYFGVFDDTDLVMISLIYGFDLAR
jgi:hypothetical protein